MTSGHWNSAPGPCAAPIAAVDAAAHAAGLELTALTAATTYAWGDPDRLVDGLLVATTYLRVGLAPDEAAALERDLRAKAQAAATERGLQDWSSEMHDQGQKRAD